MTFKKYQRRYKAATNSNELYEPYRGGAGPSEEMQFKNNLALALATGNTLAHRVIPECGDNESCIEFEGGVISYDRWGFCSDDGELDQADLETAIEYIKLLSSKSDN